MSLLKHPVSTEKALRMMESENKLVFVVDRGAKKPEIKATIERLFNVKVAHVHTLIRGSQKRAIIRFTEEYPAIDVATKLGMM